jgi:hypothetical protein
MNPRWFVGPVTISTGIGVAAPTRSGHSVRVEIAKSLAVCSKKLPFRIKIESELKTSCM